MTKENNETFIRISNKDIWNEIQSLHKTMDQVKDLAQETNGKVKMHQKILFSIGPILIIIVGWIIMLSLKI